MGKNQKKANSNPSTSLAKSPLYVTITGINHYYGTEVFRIGLELILKKDTKNPYDADAIQVEIGGGLKVGYVSNSPYTVIQGTLSAGRIYDKINSIETAKVKFISKNDVIAELNKK